MYSHIQLAHIKNSYLYLFFTKQKKSTKLFLPGHKILWYKDERRRQEPPTKKNESYGSLWRAMFVFFVPAKLQTHEKGIFNTFKARKNTFPTKPKGFQWRLAAHTSTNIFYDHNIFFLYLHP